ncbi:MAG TPA: OmpH family outer membrane protein [Terriglobia bacterium]|nr:OmpH family outer membrane protein [Terriglobia bacterium]
MIRLKWPVLFVLGLLASAPLVSGQLSKIAVVDFERAIVQSAEGKKSSDKFNAILQSKQAEAEKRQKELEDAQRKLQTQERTLSDTAKANLQKDIDRRTTELQRFNEDSQKELQSLRDELLRPIAERASAILNAIAAEQGYSVIVDVSNPQNSVLWFNPKNDITEELTRRIDAQTPKTSESAPPSARPATAPVTPRAATPAPTAPRPAVPGPAPVTPRRP